MNKESVLESLMMILSSFSYHLDLPSELISFISGSGYEAKFFSLLVVRLRQLSVQGIQATVMKEFESIEDGVYSMHLTGNGFNMRILYGFMPNGQPALLRAFYERAGKKRTDYTSQLPIAKSRLVQLREEFHYER